MIKNKDLLEKFAYLDDLTGLKNLHGLYEAFEKKPLDNVHFIYVDIDDSSTMNAIFGNEAVDGIIFEVAKTLVDYCGNSDVYKIGADQFLLTTESHIICEPSELSKILKQPVKRNGSSYIIKASVCVLDYDDFKGDTLEDLVKFMKFSINIEKRKRKNTLIFADQSMKDYYLEKKEIEQHIFQAVRRKEFFPKFQPFVDTFTNKIIGFEAVSRWNLNGKVLKPQKFLEIAEWTGLIYAIEMYMFQEAVRFFVELKNDKAIKLSSRFKASLNFSSYTLIHVKTSKLLEILYSNGCSASDFIIEIRENYITDDEAYEKVKELHSAGFLIALDEYTNNNSSLTYLADLKVDILKLGECLLMKMDTDQEYVKMYSIYKFMSDIGKKFDLTIVSTGIANAEHVKLAKSLDINIGSGKFYSKAVVKEEFVKLFTQLKKKRG